jgi:transcriptional regulator
VYIPKAFEVADGAVALAFMRAHNFATVVSGGAGGMIASHVPVIVGDAEGSMSLQFHLARANPQWQQFDGEREVLVIFQGPHGYVSPSLYSSHPSVPTWSYQAVHAYGRAFVVSDPEATRAHVLDLIAQQEGGRPEPWTPELPEEYLQSRLADVVAVRVEVARLEAKFKVSQNRPLADREAVASAFEASGDPATRALGAATREAIG